MTLRQPDPRPDDPRLAGHGTDYETDRGGWYPPEDEDGEN